MTDDFRHRTSLQVRFRDIDAFGHVNNAVFFSYVEFARIRYFLDVLQPDAGFERLPLILAQVALDFRSPIQFGDDVEIETRIDAIGRASIAMSHRMMARNEGRLVGDVQSVLVTYDYASESSIPVPDDWRRRIGEYEERTFETDAPRENVAATS